MDFTRRELLGSALAVSATMPHLLASALPNLSTVAPHANPDQWYWFPGHAFCMKANGPDTRGSSAFQLCENGPREGTPLHKHTFEDESFFVLEGSFELTIGSKTVAGGPGTYAFGPRGVPHRWTNVGTDRGRILIVFEPAGLERMFYEIGVKIPSSKAPPPMDPGALVSQMETVPAKYGMIRVGDFKFPSRT